MEVKDFIKDFENALDNVEPGTLSADTRIHELKQMDSLGVLSIIAMMHKKYQTKIKGGDIKNALTVSDLFNLINQV